MLASTGFVQTLAGLIGHFAYGSVLLLLFFAGWLCPIPEEPIIVAAGYVAYKQGLNVWLMILCAKRSERLGLVVLALIAGWLVIQAWRRRARSRRDAAARAAAAAPTTAPSGGARIG